jgi:hypothetical protein
MTWQAKTQLTPRSQSAAFSGPNISLNFETHYTIGRVNSPTEKNCQRKCRSDKC